MKNNQVSSTAIFVANGVWWVSIHPKLKVEVPELLGRFNLEMVRHINKGLFDIDHKLGEKLLRIKTALMQKAVMPGFYLHFVLRKRSIENYVRQALQDSARQLIVIGAGFDTLSVRMSREFDDCTVIEIDHPATQIWKKKALERLNPKSRNIHLLPLDLTQQSMRQALLDHKNYCPGKNSVFVAEGLTMYLNEKEVRETLNFIRENSAPGSRFIFTYMKERRRDDYQFTNASRLADFWLKMKGEVFSWGLADGQLEPFLKHSGFHLMQCTTHKELREELLAAANLWVALPIGENIAITQWDLGSNPNTAPSLS